MLRFVAALPMSILALSPFSFAGDAKLTIYDDGLSCPASCDAHVVFKASLNGTAHAHLPGTSEDPCINGRDCEVCFTHDGRQCITVMYRGGGPGEHTFDFTPSFYQQWCELADIPDRLEQQCGKLREAAASLDGRVNCIAQPDHALCAEMMATAQQAQLADRAIYEECKRVGQSAYNAGRPRAEQRAHGCAYEAESNGGPNSNGLTWKRLMPGACRHGTFVGRDGLDCCSGIPMADGPLGIECRIYYPRATLDSQPLHDDH
jgi:hypothetical protein